MKIFETKRLTLTTFSLTDFDLFVEKMLTDSRVVEHYHSYKTLTDIEEIRAKAIKDFWNHFEESRNDYGLEIWAAHRKETDEFIGWSGLLHTDLTEPYGGPELQYMLAGSAHGKGYATEIASVVMDYAQTELKLKTVIATVDIPNKPSIRILEKLGFDFEGQIGAYGSTEMYLYRKVLNS